ncbi:MAG: NUDIX domain-containing protein [Candidatus Woesearchaeota archaeon]
MSHQTRKDILLKLIHSPRASFNELWDKQGESNAFAYHLSKLVDEGVVVKEDGLYSLSADGRSLVTEIEGDTGSKTRFPTPTVVIVARDDKNRVLAQRRLKEPFFGYWGFPSGKLNFGWNPQQRAVRDLKEETGLVAESVVLRCVEHVKTFEEEVLLHHHIMYIFEAFNCSGELVSKTHKASHEWLSVDEYLAKTRFPGNWLFDYVLGNNNFFVMECERFMKNGLFVDGTLVSVDEFVKK